MRKLLLGLAFLLTGCSLFTSNRPAALKITTTPQATVFIDGKHMGTTPFLNENLEASEITLKLVPEQQTTTPWEGLIELTAGVVTVVNYEFANGDQPAAGEILTLQPNNQSVASLSVISIPDAAVVRLNNESKGFTPLIVDQVEAGDHQLVVSSPGYKDRTINIKAQSGYRLTIKVDLAREATDQFAQTEPGENEATGSAEATASGTKKGTPTPTAKVTSKPTATPTSKSSTTSKTPTPTKKATSATTPDRPYVKINDTPTGWLRVRSEPSLNSNEVGRVNPGEMFALKEEQSGWYQIEYEAGELGWIAGQYAEKYE